MLPGTEQILPPQSKEAEESLVGAALLNPGSLDEIGFLAESDFYFKTPCLLWSAMQKLRQDGTAIDFMTVSHCLETNGDIEDVGGPAAIAGIINNVSSFNTLTYARIVKDMSQRRGLLKSASDLARIAYDFQTPIAEPTGAVLDGLVNQAASPEKGARHIAHGLNQLVDYVNERRLDPRPVWGIPTGFIDFDEFTGGLHPGLVTYIGGAPGAGKTKIALQMGIQAALPENGSHPVAIYSMEMPEIEIIKRAVSGRGGVTTWDMNSGKLDDQGYEKFLNTVSEMEQLPIYTCDQVMSPQELHADTTRLKKKFGIELVVVDYLLLMGGYENMEETPRSGLLSRALKVVAIATQLPFLTVSSTTKEGLGADTTPTMRDMRGSAQVLFDADGIFFLKHCTEAGAQNLAQLHCLKNPRTVNRSGLNYIDLLIDSNLPIFHNVTKEQVKRVPLNYWDKESLTETVNDNH